MKELEDIVTILGCTEIAEYGRDLAEAIDAYVNVKIEQKLKEIFSNSAQLPKNPFYVETPDNGV